MAIFDTPVISGFNIADEDPLTDDGTFSPVDVDGTSEVLQVVSNECTRGDSGLGGQTYIVAQDADQEVHFPITTLPTGTDEVGVYLRVQDDANYQTTDWGGYYVAYTLVGGSPVFQVWRHSTGDTWTQIGSNIPQTIQAGDVIGVIVEAVSPSTSQISLYRDDGSGWALFATRMVTTFNSGGYVGLRMSGPTATVSWFAGGSINPRQSAYRWRFDNGGETAADWAEDLNTATAMPFDVLRRIRIQVYSTNVQNPMQPTLQVRRQGEDAWDVVPIPQYASSADPFIVELSDHVVPKGMPTTPQLPTPEGSSITTDFQPGQVLDNTNPPFLSVALAANGFTEYEWSIKRQENGGAVEGEFYEFRVIGVDPSENQYPSSFTSIVFARYDQIPLVYLGETIPDPPPETETPAEDPETPVTEEPAFIVGTTTAYHNFSDLYNGVLKAMRASDSKKATVDLAKSLVNTALQDIHFGQSYHLPWAERMASLVTLPRYNTGTVSVTTGSQVVLGSGTLWRQQPHGILFEANLPINAYMALSNNTQLYRVIFTSTDTALSIDPPYAGTTASGLTYDSFLVDYTLADDFYKMVDIRLADTGRELCFMDGREFRKEYTTRLTPGRPEAATMMTIDPIFGRGLKRRLRIGPPPDKRYVIPYTYISDRVAQNVDGSVELTDMASDTDEPFLPLRYRHLLWIYAMYHWYLHHKNDTNRALAMKTEYDRGLVKLQEEVEPGDRSVQIDPGISTYVSTAKRPYTRAHTSRFSTNDRFDRNL